MNKNAYIKPTFKVVKVSFLPLMSGSVYNTQSDFGNYGSSSDGTITVYSKEFSIDPFDDEE